MHVLVATDGTLEIEKTADFAVALAGEEGTTTVATLVRIPHRLLADLRSKWGTQGGIHVDSDAEYVGSPRVDTSPPQSWPGDDAVIEQYLGNKRVEIARPVAEAIRSRGAKAESLVREGDEIEEEILALTTELGIDVVIIGSHGHGAFQGLLGSTGAKLVRRAEIPVLVVR